MYLSNGVKFLIPFMSSCLINILLKYKGILAIIEETKNKLKIRAAH